MRARYEKKTLRERLVYHADEFGRARDGGAG
jgi:hypothetical protein